MSRKRIYQKIVISAVISVWVTICISGCSGNAAPQSPNAATAAPARLPGENPHAYPGAAVPKGMTK